MVKSLLDIYPDLGPATPNNLCIGTYSAGTKMIRQYDILSFHDQIIMPSVWGELIKPEWAVKVRYRDAAFDSVEESVIDDVEEGERSVDGGWGLKI
jgi:hypothetical protein